MTPDELKSIPKGQLCGHENGDASYADKTAPVSRLGHYLWRAVHHPEHAARPVAYASRQELFLPHRPGLRKEE